MLTRNDCLEEDYNEPEKIQDNPENDAETTTVNLLKNSDGFEHDKLIRNDSLLFLKTYNPSAVVVPVLYSFKSKSGRKINLNRSVGKFHLFHKDMIIIKDDCKLERRIGRNYENSFMFSMKWYFNNHLKKCIQFHYSGIGGNANNFDSCEDCFKRCYMVNKFN